MPPTKSKHSPEQPPLFSDEAAPAPAASSNLSLQIKAPKLAPAQQRFNKLLEKIERLTALLAQTQGLTSTFGPLYSSTLQPLQAQCDAARRDMVLWLDARLQNAGLTPALQRDVQAMVCALSEGMALAGDPAMRAAHDRHSPQSLADKEKAAADDIQDMLQRMAGVDVSDLNTGESVQDLLDAGMQRVRQRMLDEQEAQEARAAEAAAKRATQRVEKPRTAAYIKAQAQREDAQGALRTIYRQLASALHPDRETDEAERVRKTELMGQVNTAYERRDLMALLTLQLQCEQLDATAISRLTTEKMAALTTLLKEQAAALERDLFDEQERVEMAFGLSPQMPLNAAGLTLWLQSQAADLADAAAAMQADLLGVQTDAGLKRWIKLQKKTAKARDQRQALAPDFDEFFR